GNMAFVEAQPFAENAAARRLEDRGFDFGMLQDRLGAFGPAAIAGLNKTIANVDAFRTGHAYRFINAAENVSDQARGGGFAVGSGNGNNGNSAIVAVWEKASDHGLSDRLRFLGSRTEKVDQLRLDLEP